ncbi:amidase signature domain-containing protein [Calycina marina]|uniref:Amidase signature domain-containing protein n=1 Tax=Calycina marina TaxID=1763456 RepID=A0A9P7Z2J0_9HELO|nr:amidase signature domain-containing protein [Calycina marina]
MINSLEAKLPELGKHARVMALLTYLMGTQVWMLEASKVVIDAVYERIEAYKEIQPSHWIHLQSLEEIEYDRPPLWGVPFSVKDSIDAAGVPTTVGCPAIAFVPSSSAPVFQKCIDNGAIFIGKVNMEQLATGMTGCRSSYGTLNSTFNPEYIVGGSSSGSAMSASQGLVSLSLGSDTAGSIRIPALFNGIVGFKPTKGTDSVRGVYPACSHHDCFSVPPASALSDCSAIYQQMFSQAAEAYYSALHYGSFVLERLTILPDGWFERNNQLLHPITRQVLEAALARETTAADLFRDLHKQTIVMVVPTAPFHSAIQEVELEPFATNVKLGSFRHFANAPDLVALAMPCGTYQNVAKKRQRLPFGITILAECGLDRELISLGKHLQEYLCELVGCDFG